MIAGIMAGEPGAVEEGIQARSEDDFTTPARLDSSARIRA